MPELTPGQIEILRGAILLQLNAACPTPLNADTLLANAKVAQGFRTLERPALDKELRYLETKEMLRREEKSMSGDVLEYLITQTGRTWLDEHNQL